MNMESGEEQGFHVVTLLEDITCDNFSAFNHAIDRILDDGAMDLIIDLKGVHYITSRGLGTIVGAYAVLKRRGGNLVLAAAGEEVMKALIITRLDKLLMLVPNKETALQQLKPSSA
ncbi:MAG: STAS domain-containing protein [Candidatus Riflebacteria bacterium]|nr:STAS domain-containing protein [Candidatus Riflebacteria bacterium]